jgi:hypothetical protein
LELVCDLIQHSLECVNKKRQTGVPTTVRGEAYLPRYSLSALRESSSRIRHLVNLINRSIQQDSQNRPAEVKNNRMNLRYEMNLRQLLTNGNQYGYKLPRFRKLETEMAITSSYNDNKRIKPTFQEESGGSFLRDPWHASGCGRTIGYGTERMTQCGNHNGHTASPGQKPGYANDDTN